MSEREVWLLETGYVYEGADVVAVYSDREKAEEWLRARYAEQFARYEEALRSHREIISYVKKLEELGHKVRGPEPDTYATSIETHADGRMSFEAGSYVWAIRPFTLDEPPA